MEISEQIAQLTAQVALLSEVVLGRAKQQVTPKGPGTRIENGRWEVTGEDPSQRSGIVVLDTAHDPVAKYFSKKKYGQEVTPAKHDRSLSPVSVAEMPVPATPKSKSTSDMPEYIRTLPAHMGTLCGLITFSKNHETRQDYAAELLSVSRKILECPDEQKLSVPFVKRAVEELFKNIKEPELRRDLTESLKEFSQYVEETIAEAKIDASAELREFIQGVEKDDIHTEPTQISLTPAGGELGGSLAKGLLIYKESDPGERQFFVLGGRNVNPEAKAYAQSFIEDNFYHNDVLVLQANDDFKYSIRYMGHVIDGHENLVVFFRDGVSLLEESLVPDLSKYFSP